MRVGNGGPREGPIRVGGVGEGGTRGRTGRFGRVDNPGFRSPIRPPKTRGGAVEALKQPGFTEVPWLF